MGIEHVNRKGDRYCLQTTTDKSGKPRYSFTRKLKGTAVEVLPEGHEIYESPDDAQVFLRKIKSSLILPLEREIVARAVRAKAGLEHFIVEIEENALVVYLPDTDAEEVARFLRGDFVSASRIEAVKQNMIRRSRFSKMMRFKLCDPGRRLFDCERWCFLGRIDNWYFLSGSAPLAELVERYVKHLGKESFFELM